MIVTQSEAKRSRAKRSEIAPGLASCSHCRGGSKAAERFARGLLDKLGVTVGGWRGVC
jgi:hypothetical protein